MKCMGSLTTDLLACRPDLSWLYWAAWESLMVLPTSEEPCMSCFVEDQSFPRISCSRYDPNDLLGCHGVNVREAGAYMERQDRAQNAVR